LCARRSQRGELCARQQTTKEKKKKKECEGFGVCNDHGYLFHGHRCSTSSNQACTIIDYNCFWYVSIFFFLEGKGFCCAPSLDACKSRRITLVLPICIWKYESKFTLFGIRSCRRYMCFFMYYELVFSLVVPFSLLLQRFSGYF
jgi:hypothetical protein